LDAVVIGVAIGSGATVLKTTSLAAACRA